MSALQKGTVEIASTSLMRVVIVLGFAYGLCMGCFALFKTGGPSLFQIAATAVKVPALFLLTLAVTFPSLYVFNALVGSRLSWTSAFRLLAAALAVMLAVLASLGPIVAFFSVSTTSYPFMVLLNVLVFAVSGFLGLGFLLQTLHRLSVVRSQLPAPVAPDAFEADEEKSTFDDPDPPGALDPLENQVLGRHVKTVFRLWVLVFGLVGAQMGWVMRPFIGDPQRPFVFFRGRESNFFQAVWGAFQSLFG